MGICFDFGPAIAPHPVIDLLPGCVCLFCGSPVYTLLLYTLCWSTFLTLVHFDTDYRLYAPNLVGTWFDSCCRLRLTTSNHKYSCCSCNVCVCNVYVVYVPGWMSESSALGFDHQKKKNFVFTFITQVLLYTFNYRTSQKWNLRMCLWSPRKQVFHKRPLCYLL